MSNIKSFTFLGNYLNVSASLPFEITPGFFFDRASEKQIHIIREHLRGYNVDFSFRLYETDFSDVPEGHKIFSPLEKPLAIDQKNYFVFRCDAPPEEYDSIKSKVRLASHALVPSFEDVFDYTETISGELIRKVSHVITGNNFYWTQFPNEFVEISVNNLNNLRITYLNLIEAEKHHPSIYSSFLLFDELRLIPVISNLFILGLFSVIESLITHAPEPKDPTDSLTRQIIHKSWLLNRRFAEPIDIEKIFKTTIGHKKIWQALYAFRSSVAHGSTLDKKDQTIIHSRETAIIFLTRFAKAMLRHALAEPELVLDLQKC